MVWSPHHPTSIGYAKIATLPCESHGNQGSSVGTSIPWQRAYVERVIGTIRRECLDDVIVLNEASLYRQVKSFLNYYHEMQDAPLAGPRPPRTAAPAYTRNRSRGLPTTKS